MKFFRQTKETKRKLSFFLALAMVISLLPVTPVAKAAETKTVNTSKNCKVTVNNSTKDLTFSSSDNNGFKITESSDATTASAIITLSANEEIESETLSVNVQTTTGGATTEPKAVTSSSLAIAIDKADTKKVIVTVNDIDTNVDTTLTIAGSVTFKGNTTTTTKCNVSYDGTIGEGINFSALVGTATVPTNAAFTIDKDKEITFKVNPSDAKAIWATKPVIKVGDTVLEWKAGSGKNELTATTGKITSNVIISITQGGKVAVIDSAKIDSTTKDTTINAAVKNEVNSVSVTLPENKDAFISDVLENSKLSEEQNAAIVKALENGKATITTALKIGAVDNINNEKTKVENAKEIEFSENSASNFGKTETERVAAVKDLLKEGVVLDINLESIINYPTSNNTTASAVVAMTNLLNPVTVTMNIPTSLQKYANQKGVFYVIRIHEGKVTIIECKRPNEDTISFDSNQFSTYIVTFKPGVDPSTPDNPSNPGNNNGYIPGPGTTSSSAPSANPSVTPSTNPSGAPSANPSGAPSANPSAAPSANPSSAPSANPSAAPSANPTNSPANPTKKPSTVKVGKKATISGSQYKVTAVKGTRTVQFTKGKKNAKKIVIPSTVKVSGKKYKVTSIAKNALKGNKKLTKLTIGANVTKIGVNAFKGCSKLKSIIVKTKKLTKSKVGKNAFKGINSKATIKVPKAKVKAYKKIVQAKGAGKSVKVKK